MVVCANALAKDKNLEKVIVEKKPCTSQREGIINICSTHIKNNPSNKVYSFTGNRLLEVDIEVIPTDL